MEKTVTISGRDVRFKATGALPLRYKAQFGRDLFADMAAMEGVMDDASNLNSELFYNVVWVMARGADPSIPPVLDWVDGFDEFPVFEVFNELKDTLVASFRTTKN